MIGSGPAIVTSLLLIVVLSRMAGSRRGYPRLRGLGPASPVRPVPLETGARLRRRTRIPLSRGV